MAAFFFTTDVYPFRSVAIAISNLSVRQCPYWPETTSELTEALYEPKGLARPTQVLFFQ